jgi:regulator of telomere elongation helicase 1
LNFSKLNGQVWYSQQAFRAVNQAVGRVIRHKDDYGAIILCDERFSYDSSVKQMPSWLKSYVKKLNNYEAALDDLKSFFKVAVDIVRLFFFVLCASLLRFSFI